MIHYSILFYNEKQSISIDLDSNNYKTKLSEIFSNFNFSNLYLFEKLNGSKLFLNRFGSITNPVTVEDIALFIEKYQSNSPISPTFDIRFSFIHSDEPKATLATALQFGRETLALKNALSNSNISFDENVFSDEENFENSFEVTTQIQNIRNLFDLNRVIAFARQYHSDAFQFTFTCTNLSNKQKTDIELNTLPFPVSLADVDIYFTKGKIIPSA